MKKTVICLLLCYFLSACGIVNSNNTEEIIGDVNADMDVEVDMEGVFEGVVSDWDIDIYDIPGDKGYIIDIDDQETAFMLADTIVKEVFGAEDDDVWAATYYTYESESEWYFDIDIYPGSSVPGFVYHIVINNDGKIHNFWVGEWDIGRLPPGYLRQWGNRKSNGS